MLPMLRLASLFLISTMWLCAQDGLRGHWTGGEIPGRDPITLEVDLDKGPDGWVGSLSMPAQNVSGIPLDAITYVGGKCSFRVKGMPNDPTYRGTLSQDGKIIEGQYTEGSLKVPFKFIRTGEPRIEVAEMSPKVAQEFLGDWDGTLKLGRGGRAILRISNDESGSHVALISVDEGNGEVPATGIDQQGSELTIVFKPLGGARYVAQISRDGTELKGTFSVGGNDIPLEFKKAIHKD